MVALLAIGASLFWGISVFIIRIGLRRYDVLSALLITLVCSVSVPLVICLFTVPVRLFATPSVLYFVSARVMAPFMGRYLFYVGINRVGASIASPLANTAPLFAAIAAFVILDESLTPSIALGTFLIVCGAVAISSEESGGQIEKTWSRADLVFPLLAGTCFGVAHLLRKMGLNLTQEPILGVTVQMATALTCFPLLALAQPNQQRLALTDKRAWCIFSLGGLSTLTSHVCVFYALNLGQVVVVSPLSSLNPFFTLLLVGIFLRKLERVTWKIVLGSVLIVAGTAVLSLLSQG